MSPKTTFEYFNPMVDHWITSLTLGTERCRINKRFWQSMHVFLDYHQKLKVTFADGAEIPHRKATNRLMGDVAVGLWDLLVQGLIDAKGRKGLGKICLYWCKSTKTWGRNLLQIPNN
jgi:hypothetical protein